MLPKIEKIKEESGQSMVLFALLFVVLCGFAAFTIDLGAVASEKSQLQNAIDAASLAAAQDLPDTAKAAATANQYIQLNGYNPSDISITFSNSNHTINVAGTKEVSYTFARVLGFTSTTVNLSTAATKAGAGAAFDYAIFSGSPSSTLLLSASVVYIGGSVHSNYQVGMYGSNLTVTGSAEAVSQFSISGSSINILGNCQGSSVLAYGSDINIATKIYSPAAQIEMPDFSDAIKSQAQAAGQAYVGNKVFSASCFNIDSPIYVDGNVTICGSSFSGKGCVFATGNIIFAGSGLNYQAGDAVCFYSQNGNISINCSSAVVEGLLYAPKGSISVSASNVKIYGRLIANSLMLTGSSLSITSGTNELNSLSGSSVKLTN